jgi:hypothetical protein
VTGRSAWDAFGSSARHGTGIGSVSASPVGRRPGRRYRLVERTDITARGVMATGRTRGRCVRSSGRGSAHRVDPRRHRSRCPERVEIKPAPPGRRTRAAVCPRGDPRALRFMLLGRSVARRTHVAAPEPRSGPIASVDQRRKTEARGDDRFRLECRRERVPQRVPRRSSSSRGRIAASAWRSTWKRVIGLHSPTPGPGTRLGSRFSARSGLGFIGALAAGRGGATSGWIRVCRWPI